MKKYEELTRNEKLACVSLYPEEAKRDKYADIRAEAELYFAVKNSQ